MDGMVYIVTGQDGGVVAANDFQQSWQDGMSVNKNGTCQFYDGFAILIRATIIIYLIMTHITILYSSLSSSL